MFKKCVFLSIVTVTILGLSACGGAIPFPALEALPEAEKIAKEEYPDAQLTRVQADTGEIEKHTTRYSDIITIKTKWNRNPKPLHYDGTAEEWYFSFYSSVEKLDIIVNIVKRKSGKIKGGLSTKEVKLSFFDRALLSKKETEKKNKELQEGRESAIFDPQNWTIDSTEAVKKAIEKFGDDFDIDRLSLRKVKDGTPVWEAESAKLTKSERGKGWSWNTVAEICGVSGKIVNQVVFYASGKIVSVNVKPGDKVEQGDILCILETSYSYGYDIWAPVAGTIIKIELSVDQIVSEGDLAAIIEY